MAPVNPFQTVQREEVGTILKVTPQLNGSDTVILKLELESSSLSQSTQAVDLITNKRTISTSVMIEDGGIVVLGGLISDSATKGEQRVPFLGRIPIIGLAFKTRNSDSRKSNLMVFIRPKILRDGVQAAFETDAKYRYMQDQQKSFNKGELLPLLPNSTKPKLPARRRCLRRARAKSIRACCRRSCGRARAMARTPSSRRRSRCRRRRALRRPIHQRRFSRKALRRLRRRLLRPPEGAPPK